MARRFRDPLLQPYHNGSIWNTPLGDACVEKPAGLPVAFNYAGKVSIDEILLALDPSAPVRPLSNGRMIEGKEQQELPAGNKLPADAACRIADDITHPGNWNGIFAGLHATDDTLAYTGQPLNRPTAVHDPQMYRSGGNYPTGVRGLDDLRGDGRRGSHGGGQCGGIGGTIRAWEYDAALGGGYKIDHRLALNVDSKVCLSQAGGGFRWPAYRADAEAFDPAGEGFYGRTGQGYDGMVMGSLLALPHGYDLSWITDPLVFSIGTALHNYGAHLVDSTGGTRPRYAFSCEANREAAWLDRPIDGFHKPLMRLITSLVLIDDCTPETPGGSGSPRTTPPRPLAPRTP